MSANREHVKRIAVFSQLPVVIQERIASDCNVLDCDPKHIFFEQGDSLTCLYAILSGNVKLYRQSRGRNQILALLHSGDCFGTESLLEVPESAYYAAAMSHSKIISIPLENLHNLLQDYPEFRAVLLQVVTSRLRQFAALVHDLAFRDVTARIATILVSRADLEGKHTEDGIYLNRLMTQSELAEMAGTVREVVHRTFKKFEKAGIARISRQQIMILDLEGLRAIASEENR